MHRELALIHGALAHGRVWQNFLQALNLDVEPVLAELPGHGDAEDWDRSRDFSDQALELLLDSLPSNPVPIIGHSFGAVTALRAAVEGPGSVSSLVLIEPVFFAAVKGSYVFDKIARDSAPFMKKAKAGNLAMAAKEIVAIWGDGTPWDDLPVHMRRYLTARADFVPAGESLIWHDSPGLLREGRLESLEIPVTLIEGDKSHPDMNKIIDALGRRISDAEGIIVPGASHMVPVTHPMPVAEAVRGRLVWDDETA